MASPELTRILVVEDDVDDSYLLIRQLKKAQIDDHALVINNGQEALDFLLDAQTPPLAVFLDLRLPGLSGFDLLKRMKQEDRLKAIPVIIMSGSIDPNDLARCNQLGITAFLSKPVSLSTFIKTVAHLFPKAAVHE